jgi:hypothetical protein
MLLQSISRVNKDFQSLMIMRRQMAPNRGLKENVRVKQRFFHILFIARILIGVPSQKMVAKVSACWRARLL